MKRFKKPLIAWMMGLMFSSLAMAAFPVPFTPVKQMIEKGLTLEKNQKIDEFRLDHFKVYNISPQPANATVFLRGQFESNFIKTAVGRYIKFLNPVDKNGEGIINKHAHLNWYRIDQDVPEPTRVVTFYNQFGLQTIKIQTAVALLAPAEKIEPGSEFPQKLDHYKVYQVVSAEPVNRQVTLRDQFVGTENFAHIARYFAVPVEKRHEDSYFPILNPEDHIVFYGLEPKEIQEYRPTRDQFGAHDMKTRYCELLGVPSKKLAWEQ